MGGRKKALLGMSRSGSKSIMWQFKTCRALFICIDKLTYNCHYNVMEQRVAGFDWDVGNAGKCRKHGVSLAEIEALFQGTVMVLPDEGHSTAAEERHLAIGRTKQNRHVLVACTFRKRAGRTYIRPISARYMHERATDHYAQENPDH